MKYDGKNTLTLSTGREIYAYNGEVGINPDSTYVGGGHDDEIDWKLMRDKFHRGELSDNVTADEFLTPDERIDIANTMLRRWQRYRREALDELEAVPMSFGGFMEGLIILSKYIDHSDAKAVGAYERNILQVGSFMAEEVSHEETDELIKLGWVVDDDTWTWMIVR